MVSGVVVLLAWFVHVISDFNVESVFPAKHPTMFENLVKGQSFIRVLLQDLIIVNRSVSKKVPFGLGLQRRC